MAVLDTLINLFPGVTASLQIVKDLAVLGGGVALTGIGLAWFKKHQQFLAVVLEARGRGLSEDSANVLARCLWREGPDVTRDLMRSTESMRVRLATELGSFRHADVAERFAAQASRIMVELRVRSAAYEGAPLLFEKVLLSDSLQDQPETRVAWVVEVDAGNLHLVCSDHCNWPVRHDLQLTRTEVNQAPMLVNLMLRPMPGNREWVVSHDFERGGVDRRRAIRRDCEIEAWVLPTTAGAYTLRGRLQDGEPLKPCNLEQLEAWPRREQVVIEDISCDGARLVANHSVARGDHFYLVLSQPDGAVSALPLAEVVSVRSTEDGKAILGTRFCAVRLKERMVIADYADDSADAELSAGNQGN